MCIRWSIFVLAVPVCPTRIVGIASSMVIFTASFSMAMLTISGATRGTKFCATLDGFLGGFTIASIRLLSIGGWDSSPFCRRFAGTARRLWCDLGESNLPASGSEDFYTRSEREQHLTTGGSFPIGPELTVDLRQHRQSKLYSMCSRIVVLRT